MNIWVAPSIRDVIVLFVLHYAGLTGLALVWMLKRIGGGRDRFYDWRVRLGQANRHNAPIPREHWLEAWEQQAIVHYFHEHPGEGYRRLTWMMVDQNVVAASPSSVYRMLKKRRPAGSAMGRAVEEGHRVRTARKAA